MRTFRGGSVKEETRAGGLLGGVSGAFKWPRASRGKSDFASSRWRPPDGPKRQQARVLERTDVSAPVLQCLYANLRRRDELTELSFG